MTSITLTKLYGHYYRHQFKECDLRLVEPCPTSTTTPGSREQEISRYLAHYRPFYEQRDFIFGLLLEAVDNGLQCCTIFDEPLHEGASINRSDLLQALFSNAITIKESLYHVLFCHLSKEFILCQNHSETHLKIDIRWRTGLEEHEEECYHPS